MPGIAIVGSHVFGVYMRCEHLPVPGETVLGTGFDAMAAGDGGKGSNQAVCAARLGERVAFVGKVGRDPAGDACVNELVRHGIDCDHLYRSAEHRTGASIVLIDKGGTSLIAVDPGANDSITETEIVLAESLIRQFRVLLTQFELPPDVVRWSTALGRRLGLTTVLNPAPVPDDFAHALEFVDVLTPNEHEASQLLGRQLAGDQSPFKVCQELIRRFGVPNVIITMGSRGAVGICGGERIAVPSVKIEQKNSVGAGDGFSAALSVALSRSCGWEDAMRFACAVGAYTAASESAPWFAYPTRGQLIDFVDAADPALLPLVESVLTPGSVQQ